MSAHQEAIDRIISLCKQSVRDVLTSHDCQSVLFSTANGLRWQVAVSQTAFEQLFQHESLETLVGASLSVAPIQAIVLEPPIGRPVVVSPLRFAQLWSLDDVLDRANSNDDRAQAALQKRLQKRCCFVLRLIADVAMLMNADGRCLAIDGKETHLVANLSAIQDRVLEDVLPAALCLRWRYYLRKALQSPSRPLWLSYTLPVNGWERSYRAKFIGYGEPGEVLIVIKEISPWLRR